MDPVAMSSTTHNLWLTANILGLVVVVAVAALLSLLIYFVKVIDRRVVQVRDTLKAASANTADTPGAGATMPSFAVAGAGGSQRPMSGAQFPDRSRWQLPAASCSKPDKRACAQVA
jgi:hypothetical protein